MNPFTQHPDKEPIHRRKSHAGYHANDIPRGDQNFVMSQSSLVKFLESPSKWIRGGEPEDTSAMRWGSLIDTLVTAPDEFRDRYAVTPNTYKSEVLKCPKCGSITDSQTCRKCKCDRLPATIEKEWTWMSDTCQEWRETQWAAGKEVVEDDKVKSAHLAVDRLQKSPVIREFLLSCDTQIVCNAQFTCPVTDITIPIKGMLDLVPSADSKWGKCLGDLKCPNDASVRRWPRWVFDQSAHIQAAFYLDLYNACSGESRNQFMHVLSEAKAPFELGRRQLSEEFINLGRGTYIAGLQFYCQCLARNWWPEYDDIDSGDGGAIVDGFRITEMEAWMIR